MTTVIGLLALAAAGAWLASAGLGAVASRRIALTASALASGAGGCASVACGALLAVHGRGPSLRLGSGTESLLPAPSV